MAALAHAFLNIGGALMPVLGLLRGVDGTEANVAAAVIIGDLAVEYRVLNQGICEL